MINGVHIINTIIKQAAKRIKEKPETSNYSIITTE